MTDVEHELIAEPAVTPTAGNTPVDGPTKKKRPRWAVPAGSLLVGLVVGATAVAAGTDPTRSEEYRALDQEMSTVQTELDTVQDRLETARENEARAQEISRTATAAAATQKTELDAREQALVAREQAVTKVEQAIEANSVGDGTWTVGRDMAPGTYRTAQAVSRQCYWGIYAAGSNGSDIIDNDIVNGGFPSVRLSEGQEFKNNGCGTFVKQ